MWFLGKFTSINWTKLSRTRIGPYKMRLTDVRMEKCVDNYWGIKANHSRKSHSTDGVFHFICFTDFSGMACILSAVRRAITNYLPTLSCPRTSWTIGNAVENASATLCRSFHGHCRNYRHFCHNCATNLMVSLYLDCVCKGQIYGSVKSFSDFVVLSDSVIIQANDSDLSHSPSSIPVDNNPPDKLGLYGKREDWRTLARKALSVCNPLMANYKCTKHKA